MLVGYFDNQGENGEVSKVQRSGNFSGLLRGGGVQQVPKKTTIYNAVYKQNFSHIKKYFHCS